MNAVSSNPLSRATYFRFVLFAALTSIGYLFYESLLKGVLASLLLLNTFVFIFLFRMISSEWRLRIPFSTIRVSVDSYQLAYALCAFGYWYLFWHGIALVPAGENASKTAIAFLALNTFFAPIAAHFASSRGQRHISLIWMLAIGFVLFAAILFMERNDSAEAIYYYLKGLENSFRSLIVLPEQIAANQRSTPAVLQSESYARAAFCLIGAIICEAVADYLNVRRQVILKTQFGKTLGQIQITAARVEECRRSIFKNNMQVYWMSFIRERLQAEIKLLDDKMRSLLTDISQLDGSLGPDISSQTALSMRSELMREHETISKLRGELDNEVKFITDCERNFKDHGESSVSRSQKKRVAYIIGERFWEKALRKLEMENPAPAAHTANRFVQEAGDDLFAVFGIIISTMIFFGTSQPIGFRSDDGIYGQLFGLLVVGALGSTARLVLIAPMVRKDPSVLHLVPPIYAIRPIILFAVMVIFVTNLGIIEWLGQFSMFTGIKKPIVDRQLGWLFGAVVALGAAVMSWMLIVGARKKTAQ